MEEGFCGDLRSRDGPPIGTSVEHSPIDSMTSLHFVRAVKGCDRATRRLRATRGLRGHPSDSELIRVGGRTAGGEGGQNGQPLPGRAVTATDSERTERSGGGLSVTLRLKQAPPPRTASRDGLPSLAFASALRLRRLPGTQSHALAPVRVLLDEALRTQLGGEAGVTDPLRHHSQAAQAGELRRQGRPRHRRHR